MSVWQNSIRKLTSSFWVDQRAAKFSSPSLFAFNTGLAKELGLELETDEDKAALLSGQRHFKGSNPVASAYAGHQFGHFVPQLGDGRALILGDLQKKDGATVEVQLKGSGPTPFSRQGDGLCPLGPAIREYLVSEAMHTLGIPTSRSLAIVETGDPVYREEAFPGAVLTRVASSHLRIGTLEYFYYQKDMASLRAIVDFAIERHDPDLVSSDQKYLEFFEAVSKRTLRLVSQWMAVGFIHGVMNTDNTTLSGETIDYGPCAFMDKFKWTTVFSSIDRMGRYAYQNQANIALWNFSSLAQTLAPLIDPDKPENTTKIFEPLFKDLAEYFQKEFLAQMTPKLGLTPDSPHAEKLLYLFLEYLQEEDLHFTQSFYFLPELLENEASEHFPASKKRTEFLNLWREQIKIEGEATGKERLRKTNPALIPQNHLIEEAIVKALSGDRDFFFELHEALQSPFVYHEKFSLPPSDEACVQQTFCGT